LDGKGFRKDLIDGAITLLQQDISRLMAAFSFSNKNEVVEGYDENSSWLNFVQA